MNIHRRPSYHSDGIRRLWAGAESGELRSKFPCLCAYGNLTTLRHPRQYAEPSRIAFRRLLRQGLLMRQTLDDLGWAKVLKERLRSLGVGPSVM